MSVTDVQPRTRWELRDCGAHTTTDDTNFGHNSVPTTDNGKSKRVDFFLNHEQSAILQTYSAIYNKLRDNCEAHGLACGSAMSSKNANNNSNSSVDASESQDAPGDDNEEVVAESDAVAADQAPAKEQEQDQPAEEAAAVEAAPEESAPAEATDADQEPISDNASEYSESIATIRTGMEDDLVSNATETGSEWGDEFAPWELQVKANEFTVRDLVTMKKEYQFRVVAVNAAGRSEPSPASDVIQPRPDQKRPTPPRALRNVGTTPNSIALQWEEPEDNGGAEILGYAIQLKAGRSKQWKEIAVDVKDLTYNVTDLTEGE